MVEYHVHGGQAIIKSCLEALSTIDNDLRIAEKGEFSRRAFENNKMDLTEVEGLNDLINAQTEFQRLQAFGQMSGRLGKLYSNWREILIECLAHIEATIDFGDDAELDEKQLLSGITEKVKLLEQQMNEHLNDKQRGQKLRDGIRVAIVGAPNAGKSSLLNILADRPAAIVSSIPGTTRDIIEVSMDLGGYPVTLADTAGIRESSDEIEQEGIRRANDIIKNSDLRMLIIDSNDDLEYLKKEDLFSKCEFIIWNKSDLLTSKNNLNFDIQKHQTQIHISCKTKNGINNLIGNLENKISDLYVFCFLL